MYNGYGGGILPKDFVAKLNGFSRYLLTPHANPDADAIGATLGLAWHLRSLGKEVRIIVSPALPDFLKFLDEEGWIETYDPDMHRHIAAWPDCWVMLDANDHFRLGPLNNEFLATKASRGCIDHHLHGKTEDFDFFYIDPLASSTSEVVARTIGHLKDIGKGAAQALYAGIVDDTGNFRYAGTTADVLRLAADLMECGAQPDVVSRGLYSQGTLAKMRITGVAIERMRLFSDDRLAVMAVTLSDLEAVGAGHDDLEGLVVKPLELRSAEVSILVYERRDSGVRVSMRSKSCVDVNAVCRHFGGGGHRLASGALFSETIESVLDQVIPVTIAQIKQDAKP